MGSTALIGAVAVAAFLFVVDLAVEEGAGHSFSAEDVAEAELLRGFERELIARLEPFESQRPPEHDSRALGCARDAQVTLRAQCNQTRQRLLRAQLEASISPVMLLAADRLVALSKEPYNDEALRRAREAVRQAVLMAEERIDQLGVSDATQAPAPLMRR